jgi:hypothetical protein
MLMNQKRQFLIDIDQDMNYCFCDMSAADLSSASFLWQLAKSSDHSVSKRTAMIGYKPNVERNPVGFIFHTAFCGSTLLSRALNSSPNSIVLKEPRALFRLSEASLRLEASDLMPHIENVMTEISQPWAEQGKVVIKPTNSCNRIASYLVLPSDKVIFLYSSLEEFLISCLKKLPESAQQLNWMAKHLVNGSNLADSLGIPENIEFNLIEAAVIAWTTSIEYYSNMVDQNFSDWYQIIQYSELKKNTVEVVQSAGKHFQIPDEYIDQNEVLNRAFFDAKSQNKEFDTISTEIMNSQIRDRFKYEIEMGLNWARKSVFPYAKLSTKFNLE